MALGVPFPAGTFEQRPEQAYSYTKVVKRDDMVTRTYRVNRATLPHVTVAAWAMLFRFYRIQRQLDVAREAARRNVVADAEIIDYYATTHKPKVKRYAKG